MSAVHRRGVGLPPGSPSRPLFRPRAVLSLSTARAAALAAHADLTGPLLVADVGRHSSEVVLLVGGAVVDARGTALGAGDPVGAGPSEQLGGAVVAMVRAMLRQDRTVRTAAALNRGVLLAGDGGLCPDLVPLPVGGLRAPVTTVREPHTAALRGAAAMLYSAQRHPSAWPGPDPGPDRCCGCAVGRGAQVACEWRTTAVSSDVHPSRWDESVGR